MFTSNLPCEHGKRILGEGRLARKTTGPGALDISTLVVVDIRPVDVHDDVEFSRFYEIMRDAETYQRPDPPMWSEHECQVMFRREEPGETWESYAAYDGDEMVGVGVLARTLLDNTDKAFLDVGVAPTDRGRGIGSALVEHLTERAVKHGRTVLLTQANVPADERETHPYVRFAARHGFSLANVEVRRELPLPVSQQQLTDWAQQAAPHHQGYRIETFVDDLPEELVESFCYLSNQLVLDAPTGEIDFEADSMTPEAFRIRQAKIKEQGRTMYETLAIDDKGEAVAQSTLAVPADVPSKVYQWGTLVRKDHRGHRLGLAIKVRNLRAVQDAFPDRTKVVTTNSEDNDNMVAINVLMGFAPVEILTEFQKKI